MTRGERGVHHCPTPYNAQSRLCQWPAQLNLSLAESGADFTLKTTLFAPGWAPLPGDDKLWPQSVRVGDADAPVVAHGGVPSVHLPVGEHLITGRIGWRQAPEYLPAPSQAAVLRLRNAAGREMSANRDAQGRIWLKSRAPAADSVAQKEEKSLDLRVFRLARDDAPARLISVLDLRVSGPAREEVLDQPIQAGWIAQSLESQLPARVAEDGRIHLRVRPGQWRVTLTQRSVGPLQRLAWSETPRAGHWTESEIWSVRRNGRLRQMRIEGGAPVDPAQADVPKGWRQDPAYSGGADAALSFITLQRGAEGKKPESLTLQRDLWLDFDGGGVTARDRISGERNGLWRLALSAPWRLGRASEGGEPRLVMLGDASDAREIAVTTREQTIEAISRANDTAPLPVSGWDQTFERVEMTLSLPPGWRILHIGGADRASGDWLGRWTLLDLFLLLLCALATGKLWGARWGVAAGILLLLVHHEEQMLAGTLLLALVSEALRRAAPEGGRLQGLARAAHTLLLAALIFIVAPLALEQGRLALYPQLERSNAGASAPARYQEYDDMALEASMAQAPSAPLERSRKMVRKSLESSYQQQGYGAQQGYKQAQAQAVQTGPGEPRWRWRDANMWWDGPVMAGQQVDLTLIPPAVNRALWTLGALLLLALGARGLWAWRAPSGQTPPHSGASASSASAATPSAQSAAGLALLVVAGMLWPQPSMAQNLSAGAAIPPPELLNDLRQHLTAPPQCLPNCAEVARMHVAAEGDVVRLNLIIHAAERTAIPLPDGGEGWRVASLFRNGLPSDAARRDEHGVLWALVEPGLTRVTLEAEAPGQSALAITLPLRPHRVNWQASGWRVSGLDENGHPGKTLHLTRLGATQPRRARAEEEAGLAPSAIPPFVRVERTVYLDHQWSVETRIVRDGGSDEAVSLRLPLLPQESPASESIERDGGFVVASLARGEREKRWRSALEPQPALALRASQSPDWMTLWRVVPTPLWRVSHLGPPPLLSDARKEGQTLSWALWRGETAELTITQPQRAPGGSLTVERAKLHIEQGQRAADYTLTLDVRAGRGGSYAVTLPPGAEPLSAQIDHGPSGAMAMRDGRVQLPLRPGMQSYALRWRQPEAAGFLLRTAVPDLGVDASNVSVSIQPGQGRWLLALGGPQLGPAVLFWGAMLVFLVVAVGLSRIPHMPLSLRAWLLLAVGLAPMRGVDDAVILIGWFVLLGWRGTQGAGMLATRMRFNLMQIVLAGLTLMAAIALLEVVRQGLLGQPNMRVAGNDSTQYLLKWYQDRAATGAFPQAWTLSAPLWSYRALMLGWALWLAWSVIRWSQWGWRMFSADGLWRAAPPKTGKPWWRREKSPAASVEKTQEPAKGAEPTPPSE
ncbi:hypothetical protein MAIT1_05161 [Magnetofaba australis IT-1]|uniref:Uncharacterized protein n=1 Tax=Magnetofaba australis IT-1 TaxID=1434232 RepID=A0A1Y2K6N1_9PROT|nr:hypothetical protein MAIT1_05161 [Magnetofaba australis IT-1]